MTVTRLSDAPLRLYDTTFGKKVVMAASGILLVGFVVGHLLGNLQLFLGPAAINEYSASLRRIPALLWGARVGILVAVVAHITSAVLLVSKNADARPVAYAAEAKYSKSSYASRTMKWSGFIVFFYLVYHLAHLTFGFGYSVEHPYTPHNVYNNVVYSFQNPIIAGTYIIANVLVAMHLRHGVWSMLQTLGASHPRYECFRGHLATAVAAFILLGNVGIPASVMLGAVEPTTETFCFPELEAEPGECDGFVAAEQEAE